MTGMAQTVLGPIPTNQLGITLMHEHLLLDLVYQHSKLIFNL